MKKNKKKRHLDLEIFFKIAGLIAITPIAWLLSTQHRGYVAIGGEIFIVPLLLLARWLIKDMQS